MEKKKNPGPLRKFLARYNTPLVWVFCGVLFVAQADLVYKMVTGKIQSQDKSERDKELAKEKEEFAQLVKNVTETVDSIKNFFGVKRSKESDSTT